MPQLNGGGGDDLGANDEMISFKDEGEQEEKISENVSAERDLDDVKSSLVNESENNSSSSDSEVRTRGTCWMSWQTCDLMVLKVSIVSSPLCVSFPCQQAERRPQTRPDLESYEKTRDYFSEGKERRKSLQRLCDMGLILSLLCLTFLYFHSTEKTARWWHF